MKFEKNYEGVDYVFYLPWDTTVNAKKWIDIINPSVAIFVKYEFWINYLHELHTQKFRYSRYQVSSEVTRYILNGTACSSETL